MNASTYLRLSRKLRCSGSGLPERGHIAERQRRVGTGGEMRADGVCDLGQRERAGHGEEAGIGHQFWSKINTISGYDSFRRSMTSSVRLNSSTA